MRIIGGDARGRRLFAPEGMDTRPTADRTRESLFNILSAHLYGAHVLDLFGGTGALALEALSRGAAFAAIADVSPAAIRAIERNAEAVLKDEKPSRARILRADYRQALRALAGQRFDLVFLDPPYRMAEVYAESVRMLKDGGMLSEDAVIVLERRKDAALSLPDGFEIFDSRAYRDTVIDFVRARGET